MPRLAPILSLLAAAFLTAVPGVHAHDLQVLTPGPAELDAGTAVPARLLHATLLDPRDRLEVTVRATGSTIEALVLVPDRAPERDRSGDQVPRVQVSGASQARTVLLETPRRVRDDATGFEYLVIATVTVPRTDVPAVIGVTRGSEPTRVALRVGPPDAPFTARDPERTPRALILARGWVETAPAGAGDLPDPVRPTPDRTGVWFALALAAAGLLVAAWWVARGRATSRRRGAERAAEE